MRNMHEHGDRYAAAEDSLSSLQFITCYPETERAHITTMHAIAIRAPYGARRVGRPRVIEQEILQP